MFAKTDIITQNIRRLLVRHATMIWVASPKRALVKGDDNTACCTTVFIILCFKITEPFGVSNTNPVSVLPSSTRMHSVLTPCSVGISSGIARSKFSAMARFAIDHGEQRGEKNGSCNRPHLNQAALDAEKAKRGKGKGKGGKDK